jgi:predicted ribosomally synthesized peptide with nif11-like leader
MSIDSAKAFIERMKTDEEFKNRVIQAETAEARKAIVEEEGFDFTKKEINSVTSQLSDEELDALAGGWTCWIGCVSEISEYRWMLAQFGKDKLL